MTLLIGTKIRKLLAMLKCVVLPDMRDRDGMEEGGGGESLGKKNKSAERREAQGLRRCGPIAAGGLSASNRGYFIVV